MPTSPHIASKRINACPEFEEQAASIRDGGLFCRVRRRAVGAHQAVCKRCPEDVFQPGLFEAVVGPAVAGVKKAVMTACGVEGVVVAIGGRGDDGAAFVQGELVTDVGGEAAVVLDDGERLLQLCRRAVRDGR